MLPVHPLPAQCRHRLHLRQRTQQLYPAPRQGADNDRLHRLDVTRATRRPGILVHRLRRMSGKVPAASGYSESVGEGEGNNGKMRIFTYNNEPFSNNL